MANLKNQILHVLKSGKNLDTTLNDLSINQETLLKNHSNPVFSNGDKNKILSKYTDLQNFGKSLYRYNKLKENNCVSEALEEKENIENTVLKGGISNYRYVWHSENSENTCDICKLLDGKAFDFYDEVPERPHPNCRCIVEIIEYAQPKDSEEEPCDCYKFIEQIDELLDEITTLKEVISIRISYLVEQLGYDLSLYLENWGQSILERLSNSDNILGDLASNFVESRAKIFENSDKYYHTKANCEVAQREDVISIKIAEGAGNFRESFQLLTALISQEENLIQAIKDFQSDTRANMTGREMGRLYPDDDCGEVIKDLWPDILEQIFDL